MVLREGKSGSVTSAPVGCTMDWISKLTDLFSGLAQDPLEDIGTLMDIEGTIEERNEWLAAIGAGVSAARAGDDRVLRAILSLIHI